MFFKVIILCLCFSLSVQNEQNLLNLPEGSKCSWNGLEGKCSSVLNCKSAKDGIQRKMYPPICEFNGMTPIVCCTDCEQSQNKKIPVYLDIGSRFNDSSSKARNNCLRYLANLRYPCDPAQRFLIEEKVAPEKICYDEGDDTISVFAISRGYIALRNQFSHMALLGYGDELQTAQWLCGGSVISERYIITAAHCISSPAVGPVRFVAVGILKRSDPPELWQRYNVKSVVRHPEYAPPSKYHDIALLETDTEIQFNMNVLPACLHSDPNPGDEAEATGWGALGYHQGLADTLQAVKLQRYDEEKCSQLYPKHRHLLQGYNHTTQMCYGDREEPKDTCEGDSGGPLQIANDMLSCAYDVIGVTSYGRQCGVSAGSGIYTRVFHYIPWIESIVWP